MRNLETIGWTIWIKNIVCVFDVDCFTETADFHGLGGIPHQQSLSLSECHNACLNNQSCVAVDWEPGNAGGRNCWILTSTLTVPTTQRGVITHYQLILSACPRS